MKFIDDMEQAHKPASPRGGIYLLPNLLTSVGLFAGFYAVVAAMKGFFDTAAIAIFIAIITDGLDGRVARLTSTQSAFGAHYDSISDMVAFGIAPALVLYSWSLMVLGKIGWLAAFLYAAATALRLARFNTQTHSEEDEPQHFQGLPSPAAAGTMASLVWLGSLYGIDAKTYALPIAGLAVVVGSLMVSTFPYYSFKKFDFKGRVPFVTVVLSVFVIAGIALRPTEILFALFILYLCSGPILALWQLLILRRLKKQKNKAK